MRWVHSESLPGCECTAVKEGIPALKMQPFTMASSKCRRESIEQEWGRFLRRYRAMCCRPCLTLRKASVSHRPRRSPRINDGTCTPDGRQLRDEEELAALGGHLQLRNAKTHAASSKSFFFIRAHFFPAKIDFHWVRPRPGTIFVRSKTPRGPHVSW